MKKVILGLSGGVDSAVAAELLRRDGYEVEGLYLDNGLPGADAAKEAAQYSNIPLTIIDISAELEEKVCAPFAQCYLRGETPNPCVICNPNVKFRNLLAFADERGAEFIATGHYARVENGVLYKGVAPDDQSYMLCRITKEQLSRLILPLGNMNKPQVRELAAKWDLPAANKPDSMDICFIPDGDYAGFIERRGIVPPPGDFVDENGKVLGKHLGIHRYTPGQRRGLGVSAAGRLYVSKIVPETNRVVLTMGGGDRKTEITALNMNWLIEKPDAPIRASIRVRHSRDEFPAEVFPQPDGSAHIVFDSPVRCPAPGQAAVLYIGDTVAGGGIIAKCD